MRKSVKLAASSTLAAVAMLGFSATNAGAADAPGGSNHCGNDAGGPLVDTDDGDAKVGSVTQSGNSRQITCQIGKNNYAITYYEGDIVGGDLVYAIASTVGNLG